MNVEAMRLNHLKSVIVGIANRRRLVADAAIVRERTRTSPESSMRIPFAPIASATFAKLGFLKPVPKGIMPASYCSILTKSRSPLLRMI